MGSIRGIMNVIEAKIYGPWDEFWDVVIPWGRLSDPGGIACGIFWIGVVTLCFFAVRKKSLEVYAMLSAWLVAFGGLLCINKIVGTYSGSHDYWLYAHWDLFFLFCGFCVRSFGILFVCGIPVFRKQALPEKNVGWVLLPILAVLFLLAFECLLQGLLWKEMLETALQGQ